MQLLKSKTKEIEQLEEKLSSIGEQGRIYLQIVKLHIDLVTLSTVTESDGEGLGSPLSAGKLERYIQQYKTQITQLDEKVHKSLTIKIT